MLPRVTVACIPLDLRFWLSVEEHPSVLLCLPTYPLAPSLEVHQCCSPVGRKDESPGAAAWVARCPAS